MSGSLNEVSLIGNLGADPEIKSTADGRSIANMRLATSESWREKSTGERKERTEWHRIVCFNDGLTKVIEQYVRKGSKIFVRGQLRTRKWTDNAGIEKYSTEVVLQGFNSQLLMLDRAGGESSSGGGERQSASSQPHGAVKRDLDDEIPF